MKVSRLCVATTLVVAGLGALLAGSVVAAVKVPDDLTGNWIGFFVSEADPPGERGEAALRVDSQDRNRFNGKLAMGRLVFDIQGIVTVDPPQPDRGEASPPPDPVPPEGKILIVGIDPPQPDSDPPGSKPAAMILIRGTIGFAEPPNPDADPPGEIVADYMIVYSDGSMDTGKLELVPAIMPR